MNATAKRAVILIVEDELLIRMNAVEMIEEAGYDVIDARCEGRFGSDKHAQSAGFLDRSHAA